MAPLGIRQENIVVDFEVGDTIQVVSGAWADTVGVVQSMNPQKQSLTINVELFAARHRLRSVLRKSRKCNNQNQWEG